ELDRGLARALAALPFLATARLAHARRDVVEARDLDLEPGLSAARVAMEDVDDDARTVEDARPRRPLQVSRLARADLVVDDDDGGSQRPVAPIARAPAAGCVIVGATSNPSVCRSRPSSARSEA